MAVKKFPYAVIYNGKFYPANAEIVVEGTRKKEAVKAPAKKGGDQNEEGTSRKA